MRIAQIEVARINPAPYNPRKDLCPKDAEYQKLERSIREFGLVEPLVWNERTGHLVGGHQRFKVLLAGWDKSRGKLAGKRVEVSVVDLPLEREKALNIALNKISGDWDPRKLAELLDELTTIPGFHVALTGFDPPEVDSLLADVLGHSPELPGESFDAAAAMEQAAAAKGPATTLPGELIELGDHLLLCGDCTDAKRISELVRAGGGGRAALFATDPPYLVNYDGTNHYSSNRGNRRSSDGSSHALRSIRRGSSSTAQRPRRGAKDWSGSYGITWDDADANSELYQRFIAAAVEAAILPTAPWYCWHASRRQAMLEAEWNKAGAFVHQQIIWVKSRPILTRSFYTWQHEPCLMGWVRGNQPKRMAGEPMLPSVWSFDTPGTPGTPGTAGASKTSGTPGTPAHSSARTVLEPGADGRPIDRPDHPTPKPLELFEIPIRQHTRAGDVVYEPFCGSGTQLIAAERLKRRCLAVEISPHYCDVIVRRWLNYALNHSGRASAATLKLARRYGVAFGRDVHLRVEAERKPIRSGRSDGAAAGRRRSGAAAEAVVGVVA